MSKCGTYTLTEIVEKYCMMQFNDARRGFDNYLAFAQDAWNDMLRTTLSSFTTVWLPVHKDSSAPNPYVKLPDNMGQFFGLYEEDKCGKLAAVLISDSYSLLPKPKLKSCGCTANCACGQVCAETNAFTLITKEHTINGNIYIEKEWLETCKNGDIIRWREVPSLNEADEVEVVTHQERVCNLDTLPCGCLADTPANITNLVEYCGCRFDICTSPGIHRPQHSPCKTTAQFDDCGRIQIIGKNVKEWYALQMREKAAGRSSRVPDIARLALQAGIDSYSTIFNPRKNRAEKKDAKYLFEELQMKIIEELNPIDFEVVYRIQGEPRKLP